MVTICLEGVLGEAKADWLDPDGLLEDDWLDPDGLLEDDWLDPNGLLVADWPDPDGRFVDDWPDPDGRFVDDWPDPDGLLEDDWPDPPGGLPVEVFPECVFGTPELVDPVPGLEVVVLGSGLEESSGEDIKHLYD